MWRQPACLFEGAASQLRLPAIPTSRGRAWVAEQLDFERGGSASFFETGQRGGGWCRLRVAGHWPASAKPHRSLIFLSSLLPSASPVIRLLGGLAAAHDLSGDEELRLKAIDLADRLLPAFEAAPTGVRPASVACMHSRRCRDLPPTSPSHPSPAAHAGLVKGLVNWPRHTTEGDDGRGNVTLAEACSNVLEFAAVSRMAGDPKYRVAAERGLHAVHAANTQVRRPASTGMRWRPPRPPWSPPHLLHAPLLPAGAAAGESGPADGAGGGVAAGAGPQRRQVRVGWSRRGQHMQPAPPACHAAPADAAAAHRHPRPAAFSSCSYFEYLIKRWIQGGRSDEALRARWEQSVDEVLSTLLVSPPNWAFAYAGDLYKGELQSQLDHLRCFYPGSVSGGGRVRWRAARIAGQRIAGPAPAARRRRGIPPSSARVPPAALRPSLSQVALGVMAGAVKGAKAAQYLRFAQNMTQACFQLYNATASGAPSRWPCGRRA